MNECLENLSSYATTENSWQYNWINNNDNNDMNKNKNRNNQTEKYAIVLVGNECRWRSELPVIQITLSSGRTVEQKRELVQVLTTESARILKTKRENIRILIYEVEGENWADAGVLGLDMKNR